MADTTKIEKLYLSSLSELNRISKRLIKNLTILAKENIEHPQIIVDAIEKHITKTPPDVKLPVLYLIDAIVKNVGNQYLNLFSHSIAKLFCNVFREANKDVRIKMFSLRQTWNYVFPQEKLYALDVETNVIDPGWPITAKVEPTFHVKQRELLESQKHRLEVDATLKNISSKAKMEMVQQKASPPSTSSSLTATATTSILTSKLIGSPIPPAIKPVTDVADSSNNDVVSSVKPFTGVGENQSFNSKDTNHLNVPTSSRHAKRDRRVDSDGQDMDNASSKENQSRRSHKRSRTSKWSSSSTGPLREKNQRQMSDFQQKPFASRQFNVSRVSQESQQIFPANMGVMRPMGIMNANNQPLGVPVPSFILNERTINIDNIPRVIRFYGEVAIAFMKENGGEPKEIGFQAGERRVLVDNKDGIVLAFNDSYKVFKIDGVTYQIRFGSPLRELYINNKWYECFFGDPPANITLDGKVRSFKIEGPSPQARIGNLRTDLVVGKIDLFVDVHLRVALYLDAQVQHFELDNQTHTVQFADYFLTVLIDGEPFSVTYGGMPKKIKFGGRDRYIRFSVMPDGVVPGMMYIKNMLRTERHRGMQSPPPITYADLVMPNTIVPEITSQLVAQLFPAPSQAVNAVALTSAAAPAIAPSINVSIEQIQKLVASGILNNIAVKAETKEKSKESPKLLSLSKPESLKHRQQAHIDVLFTGRQCSNCDVRFPPDQAIEYQQHLDWHFRQNHRTKESAQRAVSRGWYYNVNDWIQYEEIEDLGERKRSWFEIQQMELDRANAVSAQLNESPVPSCVAGPDDAGKTCDMCYDQFDTFYDDENEDWLLRNAIRVDGKTYHPICFEDCNKSVPLDESNITDELHNDNAVELPRNCQQ